MNNNAFHSSLEMHQIKHQWDSTLCLITHPCPAIVMLERVFLPYLVYLWICSILSFEFSCFTRPFCLIVSSLSSASLHCSAWGPLVVLHSAWVFSSLSPLASHLKLISPPFWAFSFFLYLSEKDGTIDSWNCYLEQVGHCTESCWVVCSEGQLGTTPNSIEKALVLGEIVKRPYEKFYRGMFFTKVEGRGMTSWKWTFWELEF